MSRVGNTLAARTWHGSDRCLLSVKHGNRERRASRNPHLVRRFGERLVTSVELRCAVDICNVKPLRAPTFAAPLYVLEHCRRGSALLTVENESPSGAPIRCRNFVPPGVQGAGAGCGTTRLLGWLDVDPPVVGGATIAKLAGSSASSSMSYGDPPATLAWK